MLWQGLAKLIYIEPNLREGDGLEAGRFLEDSCIICLTKVQFGHIGKSHVIHGQGDVILKRYQFEMLWLAALFGLLVGADDNVSLQHTAVGQAGVVLQ